MTLRVLRFASFAAGLLFLCAAGAQEIKRFPRTDRLGTAWAVRVNDAALAYTGPILPWNSSGAFSTDPREQARQAFANLDSTLRGAGSDLSHLVRINISVTGDDTAAAIDAALSEAFAQNPPVVTRVRSPVGESGAVLALDAIALLPGSNTEVKRVALPNLPGAPVGVRVAVMPAGEKVFISGEAVAGRDFNSSVTATLASLARDLQYLGLGKADVVQVKAIVQPFPQRAMLEEMLADFFAGSVPPPLVMVEGGLPHSQALEIEMTVGGARNAVQSKGRVAYLTFPGRVRSPRFSSAAIVAPAVPLIFIAGLEGGVSDSRSQIEGIFSRLGGILFETGGSFSSLVKTTGYFSDKAGGRALSEIRAVYYNPAALPAATIMPAFGFGRRGQTCTLDAIAAAAP